MNGPVLYPPPWTRRLGIAGAGTIACGLAATAAGLGDVLLWARSEESARAGPCRRREGVLEARGRSTPGG